MKKNDGDGDISDADKEFNTATFLMIYILVL